METISPHTVDEILSRLDPDQRSAAEAPDGPLQIVAPAGSGKTTTLVARLAVLLNRGVSADRIAMLTFNRDAATELSERIAARLPGVADESARIEVRTFHALGRQVLLSAGAPVRVVPDRLPLLRRARRQVATRRGAAIETMPSLTALEDRLGSAELAEDTDRLTREVLEEYRALLTLQGSTDFDRLVLDAVDRLERNAALRRTWQARFRHLLVDEFQDIDPAQLRLVELLALPEDNLCVVGDDDQTIYAWRRADVRRMLDFPARHPGCRRIILATNYRCPAEVVRVASRLVGVNRERVAKKIVAVVSPADCRRVRTWRLTGPDGPDRLAARLAAWASPDHRVAILARTRTGLTPYLMALLRTGVPHATAVHAPIESPAVAALVAELRSAAEHVPPFHTLMALRAGRGWRRSDPDDTLADEDHDALDAALGWATWHRRVDSYLAAHDAALERLRQLRDPLAPIELTTIHGSKGREWDTVAVVGLEADSLPNRRSVEQSDQPARAMEEERRLAYVAVTRARRRLVLAYDPARPSPFLAEMATGRPTATVPVRPARDRPRARQPTGN